MPNFLVIGAGKAGTTSLYHYLGQHPDVFMSPVKEPNFFAAEGGKIAYPGPDGRMMCRAANPGAVTDVEDYRALFRGVSDEKAVGEASPLYLYAPKAPHRIKRYVPDARLVAVLRNPADRAYSSYLNRVREGREPASDFSEALRSEESRMRDAWGLGYHYKNRGFYHAQLEPYYALFGKDRLKVCLYEELSADPAGVAQDIFRFLEVDDAFVPNVSMKYNPASVPGSRIVSALVRMIGPITLFLKRYLPPEVLQSVKDRVFVEPPPLSREVREELIEAYREDLLALQALTGRDLSGWLNGRERA